jgi:hypothetical protein
MDRIPSYYDEYWGTHFLFEKSKCKRPLSLVGQDFKNTVLVNCLLPLLYEEIFNKDNPLEKMAFRDFYDSLPAVYNQKTRYLAHRLFGDKPARKILKKAIASQVRSL